jgi:hypothetical protein
MTLVQELLNSITNYTYSLMQTMKSAMSEASDSMQLFQRNPLQKNSVELSVIKLSSPFCLKKFANNSVLYKQICYIRVPNQVQCLCATLSTQSTSKKLHASRCKNYVPMYFKKSVTTSAPPRRTRNIRVLKTIKETCKHYVYRLLKLGGL